MARVADGGLNVCGWIRRRHVHRAKPDLLSRRQRSGEPRPRRTGSPAARAPARPRTPPPRPTRPPCSLPLPPRARALPTETPPEGVAGPLPSARSGGLGRGWANRRGRRGRGHRGAGGVPGGGGWLGVPGGAGPRPRLDHRRGWAAGGGRRTGIRKNLSPGNRPEGLKTKFRGFFGAKTGSGGGADWNNWWDFGNQSPQVDDSDGSTESPGGLCSGTAAGRGRCARAVLTPQQCCQRAHAAGGGVPLFHPSPALSSGVTVLPAA